MPARPNPAADLARMYRERIPTAPLSNYDKIIQSRLAPNRFTGGSSGLGFLKPVSNFLKTAVESLDPRFIASEGGRSVEHVYGDARELAKSVVTGEDTLSQSPSAQAYQAAGGGLGGALAAALPYVNVATAVVPTTKLLTPAGRVALGADAAERVASRQLGQAISRATPTERLAQSMATNNLGRPIVASEPMTFNDWLSQGSTLAELARGQQWEPSQGIGFFWGGQPEINDTLRGLIPDSTWQTEVQNARQIFDVAPALNRPVTVYRGITVPGPEEGSNAFADFVRSWRVGDVVEEPGLMSTSFDRNFASDASMSGTVVEIDVPAGTRALSPDMFGLGLDEQELTLPPGTKLQITSIEGNSIKARVVPSTTPTTRRQLAQDQLVRYQGSPTVRQATADATERLAQSMAAREAGIPASALPDRPTIFMRPRIYDPNPPRMNSPLEQIGPASDNSYAVGGRGGSVSFVDDQGVSTLEPAPRSGTRPDWMSTPLSERFNPTQALSPEELANLQSLERPQAVRSQFNRAYEGTSSLPEPNPLSYNLDWSTYPSYDDVDLTRIFNNDLEASMVSPIAADKYVAQQQFRQAAVDYIRNNRVTSNLSYAIIPENYVRLNTINDLLIKHPDLQEIYITIMQQRGM